MKEAHFY